MANILSDTDENRSTHSGNGSCDWELVASSPRSATTPEPFEAFLSEDDPSVVIQANYFSTLPVSMGDSSQYDPMGDESPKSEKADVNDSSSTGITDQGKASTSEGIGSASQTSEGIVSASQTGSPSTSSPVDSDFIQPPSPRCCVREEDNEYNDPQKLELQAILDELKVANEPERPTCKDHAWWTGQVGFWRIETGQANTLWSIALAAAVAGVFFLGRRWRRLRLQNEKLQLELRRKDKKICQLSYQLLRMKDTFSRSRQIPVLQAEPMFKCLYDRW